MAVVTPPHLWIRSELKTMPESIQIYNCGRRHLYVLVSRCGAKLMAVTLPMFGMPGMDLLLTLPATIGLTIVIMPQVHMFNNVPSMTIVAMTLLLVQQFLYAITLEFLAGLIRSNSQIRYAQGKQSG